MNKQTSPRIVFHRVESFFLFAAMLLAILLEAACVYWLASPTAQMAALYLDRLGFGVR